MALRQDLEIPCLEELRVLTHVMGGRSDLTAMHEMYLHQCNTHDDWKSCVNAQVVLKSLRDRRSLDRAAQEFTACMGAQVRKHALVTQ